MRCGGANVLPSADVALVIGSAAAVLAMTGPWFSMDKAVRFQLIALVPAILVAAFGILHIASSRRRSAVLAVALVVGLGGTVASLPRAGTAILSDTAMTELQSLARFIPEPDRTLVVAPHGVEWWSAWFFRTRVAQASALRTADWARYKTVLFVEVKAGQEMNGVHWRRPAGLRPAAPAAARSRVRRPVTARHPVRWRRSSRGRGAARWTEPPACQGGYAPGIRFRRASQCRGCADGACWRRDSA